MQSMPFALNKTDERVTADVLHILYGSLCLDQNHR